MELVERRRRSGIERASAEVKIRMGCGHLSSALCLADRKVWYFSSVVSRPTKSNSIFYQLNVAIRNYFSFLSFRKSGRKLIRPT
jgi:hypothetical protein